MSSTFDSNEWSEEQLDYVAARVVGAWEGDEAAGESLLANPAGRRLVESSERAAGSLDVALTTARIEPMPLDLSRRLHDEVSFRMRTIKAPATRGAGAGWGARLAWLAAAAAIVVAAIAWLPSDAERRSPVAERERLLAQEDVVRWEWTPTDDPAAKGKVSGDVVWSDREQKGFMRFVGLAPNDPAKEQYQLWIFDAERPTGQLPQFGEGLLSQRPVDGGVFNVPEDGEVVLEIDAKLPVGKAAAFAVTVEPPGGVVVSDRSRVATIALPASG